MRLIWLLISLTVASPTIGFAGELCDADCQLTIEFPDGGRIEAIESVSFRFGDGALINTGGAVTAYVSGETLTLNPGETLAFTSGGRFDLGDAGNVTYTNLVIATSGLIELTAVGGSETIRVEDGSRLALLDGPTLSFYRILEIDGELVYDDGTGSGAPLQSDCPLFSGSTIQLGVAPLILDTTTSCSEMTALVLNTPNALVSRINLDNEPIRIQANFTPTQTNASATESSPEDASESGGGGSIGPLLLMALIVRDIFGTLRRRRVS